LLNLASSPPKITNRWSEHALVRTVAPGGAPSSIFSSLVMGDEHAGNSDNPVQRSAGHIGIQRPRYLLSEPR